MRSTTLEVKERFEIGLYRMLDDQGPEYFSSAEEVQWLDSDYSWKNGTVESRIGQVADNRNQNFLYLLDYPYRHRIKGARF